MSVTVLGGDLVGIPAIAVPGCAVLTLLVVGAAAWKLDAAQHHLRPGEQPHRLPARARWIGSNVAELARYTPDGARLLRHGILLLRLTLVPLAALLWIFFHL